MQETTVNSHSLTGEPGPEDVRRELGRIVASRVFRGSQRCQSFLQYVVATKLEGGSKFLKERTLAVHVFGRDATDDLSDDSIVRVGAREVRKRLAQYYIDEGANSLIRIDLPAGSYIPAFHWHAPAPDSSPELASESEPPRPAPRRASLGRKTWILAAAALVALLTAFAWRAIPGTQNPFDIFWQPAFAEKGPLLIAIAHPIVYLPSLRAQELDRQRNGIPSPPVQRPIEVPPKLLNGSDFVPIFNQYVGFGDAEAALRVASLFERRHAKWRVRLASRVLFNDLWGTGTVLIGAFTNRWTMDLTKNMRYRFEFNAQQKPCIAEASTGCRWTVTKANDQRSAEDYILISRLPHSATNGFAIVCAGLNVYGTEEAGRIVSDPASLTPILRQLPKNWSQRNLEIVLHVAVIGDAPAQSDLVSAYTW